VNNFQQTYANLHDDQLIALAIERDTLQTEAQEALDAEIAKRGLLGREAEESAGENMPEIESNIAGQGYRYSNDPTSLTNFLKIMLWISLGVSVLSMLSDFMEMTLLSAGSVSQAEAESNDIRQLLIGLLYLATFIVTYITFLKWTYRANSNCHGFGAQGMRFSPGWSIGCYFIPILNIYRPYQAMKEIWRVSKNPRNWQKERGSALLGWWFGLWLISVFVGWLSFRMSMKADTVSYAKLSTTVSIISGVIDIPLCIVTVSLVSAIFLNQERLVRKSV